MIDLINNKRKWKKLYEDNFLNKIPPKNLESINDRNLDVIKLIFVSWYVHHALTQIHPFTDGNGRISRLLMCLILKYGGISNESFPPIINYLINKDKSKYLNCLNDADKNNYITGVEYMIEILNKSYIETSKMMKVLAKIGNDKK